jgi:hypothetical protein
MRPTRVIEARKGRLPADCGGGSRRRPRHRTEWRQHMLWTIAVVLVVLWALGLVTSYTLGGFIHVLLVVAIIIVLVRVIQGRRAL